MKRVNFPTLLFGLLLWAGFSSAFRVHAAAPAGQSQAILVEGSLVYTNLLRPRIKLLQFSLAQRECQWLLKVASPDVEEPGYLVKGFDGTNMFSFRYNNQVPTAKARANPNTQYFVTGIVDGRVAPEFDHGYSRLLWFALLENCASLRSNTSPCDLVNPEKMEFCNRTLVTSPHESVDLLRSFFVLSDGTEPGGGSGPPTPLPAPFSRGFTNLAYESTWQLWPNGITRPLTFAYHVFVPRPDPRSPELPAHAWTLSGLVTNVAYLQTFSPIPQLSDPASITDHRVGPDSSKKYVQYISRSGWMNPQSAEFQKLVTGALDEPAQKKYETPYAFFLLLVGVTALIYGAWFFLNKKLAKRSEKISS